MVTALWLCSLWAKRVGQQGEEAKSAGFVQEYLSILRHLVSEPLPSQQHICHKMVSLICTLRHHTDEVTCCAFSPSLLATSSGDKTLRVYTTADFSELPFSPLRGHGYGVHCCCFSSCGGFLLSCSTDGSVIVWSAQTGEVKATLEHPGRSPLRVCALAPDSSLLLAGACDGTAALWDFRSKTLRRYGIISITQGHSDTFSIINLIFSKYECQNEP